MRKIFNWLNYEQQPGQVFELASLTVPDQTMSIKEMLRRHAAGIQISGNPTAPIFDEDGTGLDVRKLDLVDLQRLKQENQARVQQLQKIAAEEAAEGKKRAKERRKAEAIALLQEINPAPPPAE